MKRKIFMSVLIALMVIMSIVGLSACNGGANNGGNGNDSNGGGDVNVNSEFEEYETIAATVIKNSREALAAKSAQSVENKGSFTMSFGQNEKDALFDYLSEHPEKVATDNTSFFTDVFQQSFFIPLICGYAIREHHGAQEFYDVKIALPFYEQYIETKSEGTVKTTYCYSDDINHGGSGYCEFLVVALDYKSESDYNFKVVQFSRDYTSKMFIYGNSDMEFFAMSRYDADEPGYITFNAKGESGYAIYEDAVAFDYCYEMVEEEFTSIDKDYVKSVMENSQYTLAVSEWNEASQYYIGEILTSDAQDGQFDIIDGVLYGWMGEEADCPSSLVLPSDVKSIYYSLRLPSHVKELTIPASVNSIKIEKGYLDILQGGKGDGEYDDTLVECPTEFFEIILLDYEGEVSFLNRISVGPNSPLFKVKNQCLYSTDDYLLYIPVNNSITSLTIDASKMSVMVETTLSLVYLPNLKTVDVTPAFIVDEENEQAGWYINPLEWLFLNDNVTQTYNLEKLIIRGASDRVQSFNLNGALASVDTVEIYGSNVEMLNIDIGANVGHIKLYDGLGGSIFISNEYSDEYGRHKGDVEKITLHKDVEHIQTSVIGGGVIDFILPWSTVQFYIQEKYMALGIYQFDVDNYDFNASEMLFEQEQINAKFAPLQEEDLTTLEHVKNFSYEIVNYDDRFDCEYIRIIGYRGESPILTVPETMLGYPVYSFSDQTIADTVTEFHLPACLKEFIFSGYSSAFTLDKIVYEGTAEQLAKTLPDLDINRLLAITKRIECSDTTIDRGRKFEKESYSYTVAGGNIAFTVNIDWSLRFLSVEFFEGDDRYYSHDITSEGYIEDFFFNLKEVDYVSNDGVPVRDYEWHVTVRYYYADNQSGEIAEWLTVQLQKQEKYATFVDITTELQSVTEFYGEIKHEYGTEPVYAMPPTCSSWGAESYECMHCGKYYTKKIPSLEHELSEPETIPATCTVQEHKHRRCLRDCGYEEDYDWVGECLPCDYTSKTVDERVPSTCNAPEYVTYICDVCGQSGDGEYVGEITGEHKFEGEDGLCTVCNENTPEYELESCYLDGENGWRILKVKAEGLTEFTIPESIAGIKVLSIGYEGVFANSANTIKSLSFGQYLREEGVLESNVKSYLSALERISGSSVDYKASGNLLYSADGKKLLAIPARFSGEVALLDTVVEIADGAFKNMDINVKHNITSVILPEGITQITWSMFSECDTLQSITMRGVTKIEDCAFYKCTSLRSVVTSRRVISIGNWAFSGCGSLVAFDFGDAIESIGDNAFAESALKDVSLPNTIRTIGKNAFDFANLDSIAIASGCENYSTENNILYNADKTEIIGVAGGAKEAEECKVSVRHRSEGDLGVMSLDDLSARLKAEVDSKKI